MKWQEDVRSRGNVRYSHRYHLDRTHPPADLNFDFNRHFLEHRAYQELAKHTVFTKGRSPEETRDEILGLAVW